MLTDEQRPDVARRARYYLEREGRGARDSLFAILDSARAEDVPVRLEGSGAESVSLYRGEPEESLADVAPYLVQIDADPELLAWVTDEGWGDSWGVFLTSPASLEDLRKHFRRFLMAKDDEEQKFYFRFYDPRVLRIYLPTCTADEIRLVFGPVRSFLMESERADQLLRFSLRDDGGVLEAISLSDVGEREVTALRPAEPSDAFTPRQL